jgi:hypothetical protein
LSEICFLKCNYLLILLSHLLPGHTNHFYSNFSMNYCLTSGPSLRGTCSPIPLNHFGTPINSTKTTSNETHHYAVSFRLLLFSLFWNQNLFECHVPIYPKFTFYLSVKFQFPNFTLLIKTARLAIMYALIFTLLYNKREAENFLAGGSPNLICSLFLPKSNFYSPVVRK